MKKTKNQKKNVDRRVAWAEKRRKAGMCITCGKEKLAPTSKLYGALCLEGRRASYHVANGRPVPKRRAKK